MTTPAPESPAATKPLEGPTSGPTHKPEASHHPVMSAALVVAAIGVVFGDIGTSPLYTIQECFSGEHGLPASRDNVLGIISLIVWSVTMVVTVKYLAFLMRADNRGEGGIFSLLALVPEAMRKAPKGKVGWLSIIVIAGLFVVWGWHHHAGDLCAQCAGRAKSCDHQTR